MKIIAIRGFSNSGKTTVCESLIKSLTKRAYTVGTIKWIHDEHFTIDKNQDKDTGRHRAAGATMITARSRNETAMIFTGKLSLNDILATYKQDFVILEGGIYTGIPKIITAIDNSCITEFIDAHVVAISGVIANNRIANIYGLPVFNALSDSDKLCEFVISHAKELV